MKSFLLFSSIFYLLGLKIGHKIDLFKNHHPVEKISTTKDIVKPVTKSIDFNQELESKNDSVTIQTTIDQGKTANDKSHF
jgi:hypothetical protein